MNSRLHDGLRLLVLGLALGTLLASEAQALSPHIRDGWLFGVSYGYGRGKASLFPGDIENQTESGWQRGAVPQYRIGHIIIKNRLMLSFENRQWLYETGFLVDDKGRVNIQNWTFALSYYPGKPTSMAGGIYLQAGAGWANARLTFLEPLEDDPWGNKFEEIEVWDEAGTGFFIGGGYEFRITPGVGAGLAVSYVYQSIGGEIFDKAWSFPATITLNWYW